jgi:hypothetical protein
MGYDVLAMSTHAHPDDGGQSLNALAFSATVRCLTGCAIAHHGH